MAKVYNETESRRPMVTLDDKDLVRMQRERDILEKQVAQLDILCKAKNSDFFKQIVLDSYHKLEELERVCVTLPSHDPQYSFMHAELKGRWKERFQLTQEMISDKRVLEKKKGVLSMIGQKIELLMVRLNEIRNSKKR